MFTSERSNASEAENVRVEDSQCPPRSNVAIETLSDDVLLEIFALFLVRDEDIDPWYEDNVRDDLYLYDAWYALAHVCQRWRYVLFASPRRLNLRLHCSRRRVREMLGVWPAFPIIIWDNGSVTSDEDNIIAALEHRDRVCEIKLGGLTTYQSHVLLPFMQESFPALAKLQIMSIVERHEPAPVLPDSFLGGSAPHLRFLSLDFISFPALPNLLLSTSNLVHLYLDNTQSGYISPEIVAALSALTKLEEMRIFFHDHDSDSGLEHPAPPPLTRSVLPALGALELKGGGEYLDDFVARIDFQSIHYLKITFTSRPFYVINFFQLPQLIGRVEKFRLFDYAGFDLSCHAMNVTLSMQKWTRGSTPGALHLGFLCDTDDPLRSLVEAYNSSLLPLSNIDNFAISTLEPQPEFNTEEGPRWLEVLRQCSPAKSLSLGSMHIVKPVAFVLKQVIEEGMTDVLPTLQNFTYPGLCQQDLSEKPWNSSSPHEVSPLSRGLPSLIGSFKLIHGILMRDEYSSCLSPLRFDVYFLQLMRYQFYNTLPTNPLYDDTFNIDHGTCLMDGDGVGGDGKSGDKIRS